MADNIIGEIKAAQAAPVDDYIVWADVSTARGAVDVVLQSVRLPQSIDVDLVLTRIQADAKRTLAECGFSPAEAAAAELHITALPDAMEVSAIIDETRRPDSELILVDLVGWEAMRLRLHLTPYLVANGEMEMDLKGLKIRRSAAS